MNKEKNTLRILTICTFFVSPLCAWLSILENDETAVFASLSRMIWYSGAFFRILICMIFLFAPMLVSFFLSHNIENLSKKQKLVLRGLMILSCVVLYVGAMELMPSDGETMTKENVWHGILSFGGMFMIFLTYCIYTLIIRKKDKDGAMLIAAFLVFSLITSLIAVDEIYDETSYVIASAISELYVLTMMSLVGYLTYYLAYRSKKEASQIGCRYN